MRQDDWLPTNEDRSAQFLPGVLSVSSARLCCNNIDERLSGTEKDVHDNEYRQGSTGTTTQIVVFAAPPYFYPKSEEVSHDLKGIKHPDSSALEPREGQVASASSMVRGSQHLGIPTSLH